MEVWLISNIFSLRLKKEVVKYKFLGMVRSGINGLLLKCFSYNRLDGEQECEHYSMVPLLVSISTVREPPHWQFTVGISS
jgi:hypothetical protein